MYPNQLLDLAPESDAEIKACATEIIQVARMIISRERFELHFIVFSLSIAGLATKDPTENILAMDMIRTMEGHCHSRTIESGQALVESMYESSELRHSLLATLRPWTGLKRWR